MSQAWGPSEQHSYDRLMVSVELGLGHLSLLIAVCDDLGLRERVMEGCHEELKGMGVRHVVRSLPAKNPSLYAVLRDVGEEDVVVSVVGVESLLEVDIQTMAIREQTELFGYLQWTREALREFAFPVVLWVPGRLVGLLEEKAPDFWGWRSGVFWFGVEPGMGGGRQVGPRVVDESLEGGELEALLRDIDQLQQAASPDEALLADLYTKLGDIYTNRYDSGRSRQFAIRVFQSAVNLQRGLDGNQQKLAQNLEKLGNLYFELRNQVDKALSNYEQAIVIYREVGDRLGEANTLKAIADVLQFKKRSDEALSNYEQAIVIYREVGSRLGEANTLKAIGDAQTDLELAIKEYFQPALRIYEHIGTTYSQARILTYSIAPTYLKQGDRDRAKSTYEKALTLWQEINFSPGIETCTREIQNINELKSNSPN